MTNKFSPKILKTGSLAMHDILVTGASGFIGKTLIPELINEGAKVIGVDLKNPNKECEKFPESSFTFFKGEFTKLEERLVKYVQENGSKISYVIHLAGMSNVNDCNDYPYRAFQSNVGLTVQVLEFCKKLGIGRLIFPSTGLVYGYNNERNPIKEDSKKKPENIYAWTKLSAEKMIQGYSENYGLKAVVGRISNVYGGFIKTNTVLGDIVKQVRNQDTEVVIEDGTPIRDFIFINDVVSALLSFITIESGNKYSIYNISCNKGTSILELAEAVCKINGVPKTAVKSRKPMSEIGSTLVLDNSKLMNTGWKSRYSLNDGLRIMKDNSWSDE